MKTVTSTPRSRAGRRSSASRHESRLCYEQAYYVRRRFTVLDAAIRMGVFESTLDELFDPQRA